MVPFQQQRLILRVLINSVVYQWPCVLDRTLQFIYQVNVSGLSLQQKACNILYKANWIEREFALFRQIEFSVSTFWKCTDLEISSRSSNHVWLHKWVELEWDCEHAQFKELQHSRLETGRSLHANLLDIHWLDWANNSPVLWIMWPRLSIASQLCWVKPAQLCWMRTYPQNALSFMIFSTLFGFEIIIKLI